MRTCTGCRKTAPQRELVRLAFDGPRLVVDPTASCRTDRKPRRLPGRGAYVHARAACVTVAGLSRSLRRQVTPAVVVRLVAEMSPSDDNCRGPQADQPRRNASQNDPGHEAADTVEMPALTKAKQAKDDRSEDARL